MYFKVNFKNSIEEADKVQRLDNALKKAAEKRKNIEKVLKLYSKILKNMFIVEIFNILK